MADNNDEQYLDDLLNSLRTSNTDENDKIDFDKDDTAKTEQPVDTRSDAGVTDSEASNDDIFALEENDVSDAQLEDEPQEEEQGEDVNEDGGVDDSLMQLFNQINGGDDEAQTDTEQNEAAEADNGMDDILTLTDDPENEPVIGEESNEDISANDTTEAEASKSVNMETMEGADIADSSKKTENEAAKTGRETKAEAAKIAKEAKNEAVRAAKKAKAEEKARKKAEKKAKKEQLKAEKAARKNKADATERTEETQQGDDVQNNVNLINELYSEVDNNPASGDDIDSIPERDEEEVKKPKKEKKKKEPKPKKPKKEKVKKEKKEPRPSELVKVTKGTFIGMAVTIVLITVLVFFGTKFVTYGISISQAKEHFNNGKYDQAFDSISGLELRNSDKNTYYAIRTVASVYADYCSYVNYNKIGMKLEAIDALIKGLLHYEEYYPDAEKYAVLDQYDAVREQILSELSNYGISEEDALYYGSIESEQQYREILSDIGGVAE